MKRLKQRLTLKSNQSNDDWYRNVFKRRPKVSRDDAIDHTGKTTAISVTMLITITKTVSDRFGGRLDFAASLYVCPLQNDDQPSSMLDRDWGGAKPTPRHKFSVTSVGVIFNQWGVKPPQSPPRQIERCSVHDTVSTGACCQCSTRRCRSILLTLDLTWRCLDVLPA